MKKVLLINLPSSSVRMPEENCGLACLSAYLKLNSVDVKILDAYALRINLDKCKIEIEKWVNENRDNQLFICISPFVTSYENLVEVGRFIKKLDANIHINLGGHFATLNKEYLLENHNWIDSIIVGEGEISLLELVQSEKDCNIAGVYCRRYKADYKPRGRIRNLDILPYQDRYLNKEILKGQPYCIYTSRGCYANCTFCSISTFYGQNDKNIRYTSRSVKCVYDEIKMLKNKYEISNFKIIDDNFFKNTSNDFLEELASKLKSLNVSFRLSARSNDITKERAKLLKMMGVSIVGIGVESANSESLKLYNKGISLEDSVRAIQYLNEENITCLINYIMFNPIIDLDGLYENLGFVETYAENSIFHRINSHLWLRSTDSVVDKLEALGLCQRLGFPYVKCSYKHKYVEQIKYLFDIWCESNNIEYYKNADVLMANGIIGNEQIFSKYKSLIKKDIEVLKNLLNFQKDGNLEKFGKNYIIKITGKR